MNIYTPKLLKKNIKNPYRSLAIMSFIIALTGCSTLPATKTANNLNSSWDSRQKALSALNTWQTKGAVAFKQGNEGTSASLYWEQIDKEHYTLILQGPLGAGAIKINGLPSSVTMTSQDNQTITAPSAEELLKTQTGWSLPVSYLYYWARGLPVPTLAAEIDYDTYHHITELKQAGWDIRYLQYTAVNDIDLPSKMTLQQSSFTTRLIFSQWTLG
jgi:outer membrane lipoprotein LolB